MSERKQLGKSMIDDRNRVTLIKPVIDVLRVKVGNFVFYELNDKNEICLVPYSFRRKPNSSYQSKEREGDETRHNLDKKRSKVFEKKLQVSASRGDKQKTRENETSGTGESKRDEFADLPLTTAGKNKGENK